MLKLCSFAKAAFTIPIGHKRGRGKPAKTTSAFVRQPNECQYEADGDTSIWKILVLMRMLHQPQPVQAQLHQSSVGERKSTM